MSDVFVQIGDTVHIADPQEIAAPIASKAVETLPDIAALLAASRAAHARFQTAAGHNDGRGKIRHPDDDAAAVAIQDARRARIAAEVADSGHTDPAWAIDQAANKGISSDSILSFYHDYFAPDVPL